MITLISTIIGFLGSGIPHLVQMFQDKNDKKHELEIMRLQMEAAKHQAQKNLDAIGINSQAQQNIQEIKSLYATYKTGINWVDALNGLVRPTIAFALIGLYCVIEFMIFGIVKDNPGISVIDAIDMIWDEEDHIFFGVVISYYFGSRAIDKWKGRN